MLCLSRLTYAVVKVLLDSIAKLRFRFPRLESSIRSTNLDHALSHDPWNELRLNSSPLSST